jgi:hypothetical protein
VQTAVVADIGQPDAIDARRAAMFGNIGQPDVTLHPALAGGRGAAHGRSSQLPQRYSPIFATIGLTPP